MFESGNARTDKLAANPDFQAVALVAEAVRQCSRYVKLLDEHDPEARKELTPFIDESHQWLANLRGLMPRTNCKARRLPKAKKRSG